MIQYQFIIFNIWLHFILSRLSIPCYVIIVLSIRFQALLLLLLFYTIAYVHSHALRIDHSLAHVVHVATRCWSPLGYILLVCWSFTYRRTPLSALLWLVLPADRVFFFFSHTLKLFLQELHLIFIVVSYDVYFPFSISPTFLAFYFEQIIRTYVLHLEYFIV